MADVNIVCSIETCETPVDERALSAVGLNYLNTRWVDAVRSGETEKCLAHYLDTDIPEDYYDFITSPSRSNREIE